MPCCEHKIHSSLFYHRKSVIKMQISMLHVYLLIAFLPNISHNIKVLYHTKLDTVTCPINLKSMLKTNATNDPNKKWKLMQPQKQQIPANRRIKHTHIDTYRSIKQKVNKQISHDRKKKRHSQYPWRYLSAPKHKIVRHVLSLNREGKLRSINEINLLTLLGTTLHPAFATFSVVPSAHTHTLKR